MRSKPTIAQLVKWSWNRRVEYWVTHSSVCSFTHTAHSFALLALSAAFNHLLAHSITIKLVGKRFLSMIWMPGSYTVLAHSAFSVLPRIAFVCFSNFLFPFSRFSLFPPLFFFSFFVFFSFSLLSGYYFFLSFIFAMSTPFFTFIFPYLFFYPILYYFRGIYTFFASLFHFLSVCLFFFSKHFFLIVIFTCEHWVETVWKWNIHFIDKTVFPMRLGANEWAGRWANERSDAQEQSEQCGVSK